MSFLSKLFNTTPAKAPVLSKDAIAELLKTDKSALDAFEQAYMDCAMEVNTGNLFDISSKQAAAMRDGPADLSEAEDVIKRAVAELLAQTPVYIFDGKLARSERPLALPGGTVSVERHEIEALPKDIRPQLTGNLMRTDTGQPSYPMLLYMYQKHLEAKRPAEQNQFYGMFRGGLDTLDLDEIIYAMLGLNRNSMGHWLPQLVAACEGQEFFKIPATVIAKVPLTLLQMSRLDYELLTSATLAIVDQWAYEAFRLDENKDYFIKTGTYSLKFDFRNARVTGAKEVRELGEYLLYIQNQAVQMASYLQPHPTYGVSTTNEWVVREYIPDKEGNPCIYKGMPLHTEYRVFVDCDSDQVLGISPYWEPNTMKNRFGSGDDANSPHQMHDYVIYKAHEDVLMGRYHENKDRVLEYIQAILPGLDLKGQWSIDVMQNGDDFWLIDMAVAENSTFYDCVPRELRRPSKENWLPELPSKEE